MKLGIMQPYFFPYLGYFDLINYADRWIVFDTVQYIRHGWVNRNRILHPNNGWQYIVVPLKKHSRSTIISDIAISEDPKWHQRILGQIQHYKKQAPNFRATYQLIRECLTLEERSISRFNVAILEKICRYLEIKFEYEYFSEMKLKLEAVEEPGDWALRISEKLKAKEYVNPPGAATIFDSSKFEALGIKLTIRKRLPMQYECPGYEFISRLSIIDALMWNSTNDVKDYLDKKIKKSSSAEPGLLCFNESN